MRSLGFWKNMKDKEVNQFLRAAEQRFSSATILLHNSMWFDAAYLSGYVPECALKALILSKVRPQSRQDFKSEHFRGNRAHNYDYLKGLIKNLGIVLPIDVAMAIKRIASWSTDMRYEAGRGNAEESELFLKSAKIVLDWVKRSV
jgi:HEPN domain-containing protein